jgi:hypothetical protein
VRRDEIRIFPGNIEAHIERLHSFPDDAAPVAQQHAEAPGEMTLMLEYMEPPIAQKFRSERRKKVVRILADLVLANVARAVTIFMGLALVLLMSGGRWQILLVALGAVLPPFGIWCLLLLARHLRGQHNAA